MRNFRPFPSTLHAIKRARGLCCISREDDYNFGGGEISHERAMQGDPEAQFHLGVAYLSGLGVPENHEQAAGWFRKSAHQGFAPAQNELGAMLHNGTGVGRNDHEALAWYGRAADQGYLPAIYNIGRLYRTGSGAIGLLLGGGRRVLKDYAESLKWIRMAADQGFLLAIHDLGAMYTKGHGVPFNPMEAYIWFSVAVELGNEGSRPGMNLARDTLSPEQLMQANSEVLHRKIAIRNRQAPN